MTFCPGCGTENDISTKYCRECGKRLPASESDLKQQPRTSAASPQSDTELGDVLYQGFQFYETGDYAEAEDCCRQVLQINPNSGSAHTLLSMIFEKQGDGAAQDGQVEAAKAFYVQAVQAREQVLKLSPGSVVDAQKLKELKRKLRGDMRPARPDVKMLVQSVRARLLKVPTPVLASVAATILVFFLALAIMGAGGGKKQTSAVAGTDQARVPTSPSTGQPNATGAYPQQQYPMSQDPSAPEGEDGDEEDAEMLFTDPGPTGATSAAAAPSAANPAPTAQSPVPKMAPPQFKLPDQVGPLPGVQIVPIEPPAKSAEKKPEEKTDEAKPAEPAPQPNQMQLEVKTEKTGSDYQREAMQLYSDGNSAKAAEMFKKAIDAYNDEISRGKNAEAASAGIRTCRSYLQILGN